MRRRKFNTTETSQEQIFQKEILHWEKKIKKTMSQFLEEEDDDMRIMMRDEIKKMKDSKKEIEKMILQIEEEKKNKKQNILNALNLSKIAQKTFLKGKKSQKRAILLGLGSNWKIGDKKVDFMHHKEVFALAELKKFQLGVNSSGRTGGRCSTIKKTPSRESMRSIWSG